MPCICIKTGTKIPPQELEVFKKNLAKAMNLPEKLLQIMVETHEPEAFLTHQNAPILFIHVSESNPPDFRQRLMTTAGALLETACGLKENTVAAICLPIAKNHLLAAGKLK